MHACPDLVEVVSIRWKELGSFKMKVILKEIVVK